MIELTTVGTVQLDELCEEYKSRTGKEISQNEMIDALIEMGHRNLIGMWL